MYPSPAEKRISNSNTSRKAAVENFTRDFIISAVQLSIKSFIHTHTHILVKFRAYLVGSQRVYKIKRESLCRGGRKCELPAISLVYFIDNAPDLSGNSIEREREVWAARERVL